MTNVRELPTHQRQIWTCVPATSLEGPNHLGWFKEQQPGQRKNNFHPRVSTVLLAADPLRISCKLNFMAPQHAPRMNFGMYFITQARTSTPPPNQLRPNWPAVEARVWGTKRTSSGSSTVSLRSRCSISSPLLSNLLL